MYCVYTHTRKDTNKIFYIGVGNIRRPYSKVNRNKHWYHIANKHEYTVNITHRDLIWEEACAIERYLIAFYGRLDLKQGNLVNMTDGGDGAVGLKHSDDTKRSFSEIKRKLYSDKTKHPLYGRRGENSPNYGKKKSKETIEKIRSKQSGVNCRLFGKTGAECINSKPVIDNFTGVVYPSIKEAANSIGICYSNLRKMLCGTKINSSGITYLNNQKQTSNAQDEPLQRGIRIPR
jgi:hypothetical protein